jgi:hypothetical protein
MKKTIMVVFIFLVVFCQVQAQKLAVTSPNGGETLVLGKPWSITWAVANVPVNVKLQLIKPGGAIFGVIATNLASTSSPYPWTIGQTASGVAPAGSYKIRVIALDGSEQDTCDGLFTISEDTTPPDTPPAGGPVLINRAPLERLPPLRLKFPRLEVSGIDLAPNTDGFGIVFSYKNVGEGALPKASEVPVKPNYRVLIDGKETASGSLFIPAFAAPPGWEQQGYFGGWIVLPTFIQAQESNWHIGQTITVHINENKALGMESHSLSRPLKPIALKYKCDALINGVSFDWQTRVLTVSLRYEGQLQPLRQVNVTCSNKDEVYVNPKYDYSFFERVALKEGQGYYTISKKISFPADIRTMTLYVKVFVALTDTSTTVKAVDVDNRNNFWKQCKFTYPDPNPVM